MLFEALLQTPDTTAQMLLGYTLIFSVGVGYIISLIVRRKNLMKDIQVLEKLED